MKVSGFEKFILLFNLHAYSNVSYLDREGDVLQLMVSDLDTSHSSIEKNHSVLVGTLEGNSYSASTLLWDSWLIVVPKYVSTRL